MFSFSDKYSYSSSAPQSLDRLCSTFQGIFLMILRCVSSQCKLLRLLSLVFVRIEKWKVKKITLPLFDLIFFSINFVPSLVISTLSLITLLLNLYFVHKAEGSFWADFILGLIWLLASATALNFFMSQRRTRGPGRQRQSCHHPRGGRHRWRHGEAPGVVGTGNRWFLIGAL